MSNIIFAVIIAVVLLAGMFVWVPLLQGAEVRSRRYSSRRETMPDLRDEEDDSPRFSGEIS
ncbi:MAG: hypothetical protein ABI197_03870 [Granulicella sp.]